MAHKKVFLVADSGFFRRKKLIEELTSFFLGDKEAPLGVHIVYCRETSQARLEELLMGGSFSRKKVVILRGADALPRRLREYIVTRREHIDTQTVLIFEVERDFSDLKDDKTFRKDALFGYLLRSADVYGRKTKTDQDAAFGLLFAHIRSRRLSEALYDLGQLFLQAGTGTSAASVLGMQILAGLTRQFSSLYQPRERARCFELLWKTERTIKRGIHQPHLALELLITKLLLR